MEVAQTCFQLAEGIEQRIQARVIEGKLAMKLKLSSEQVLDAYLYSIKESMVSLPPSRTKELIPLDAFLNTVKLLMFHNKFTEAISVILYGSQVYNSAALCLYLGILYYRLDKMHEAEDVLLEGNLLNPRNADIWAYLCIVCIAQGYSRLSEAEDCLFQTLRLGQNDPNILREIATAFISMDKLQTAEDLIRRTIAIESAAANNGSGKNVNPYTRKLLADVLAGQNLAAKAIDEYKNVLTDENVDVQTKLSIAEKCTNLLVSLGREEELTALNNIITNLRIQQLQQQ
jgi:predicted Zn-dependent protease